MSNIVEVLETEEAISIKPEGANRVQMSNLYRTYKEGIGKPVEGLSDYLKLLRSPAVSARNIRKSFFKDY